MDQKSLSTVGQTLHRAITKLQNEASGWDQAGVCLAATTVFGLGKDRLEEYLANVKKHETTNAKDIHRLLQDRNALVDMQNEINQQLVSGNFDLAKIQILNASRKDNRDDLSSVTDDLKDGAPEPPSGPMVNGLTRLMTATNGLFGLWLIAGVPAIGKSTMAAQISLAMCRENVSTLYYDFQMSRRVMLHRFVETFGLEKMREIGKKLFLRESLRTLNRDITRIKPPALLVIDSIQNITTSGDERRVGLDAWIRRFEELKQEGYTIILVSEINRESYSGIPRLDAFKETGALEYAADAAVVLTEADNNMVWSWLVKNRHYAEKGKLALMERNHAFWFSEVDLGFQF